MFVYNKTYLFIRNIHSLKQTNFKYAYRGTTIL